MSMLSTKGLKWWGEVEAIRAKANKAKENYEKKPTQKNKEKYEEAKEAAKEHNLPAYYD